ncbi:PASTA domain-containing protein [uncultured Chryseobacterium sp.]|uniref:PASTA domain-containing protein n=1 Tax=uncultured Chryseobacterium sp. TaxID=259322 RepID=UPI0025CC5098|nr:PASTA domain-containing protein [uncultured Chryseobacterium sp.]
MLKSLFNWKVLLNLLVAIGVFVGLIWLTFRWLEYYTDHGQEIPVPNVMNMTAQEAVKVLDDASLKYKIDSFNYDPKYKPYQVLKVYPLPSSRVKPDALIQVMVNPKTWAPVAIPDVVNKYSGLAFQRLDQVGLKIGDTIFEPSIQKDAVLRILYKGNPIKPGSLVPRFSMVDVVLGSGPMRNISIPNVVGLTVKEARSVIARSLFEVGLVDHEDGGRDESDIIYYQDPASGDMRDQGMQIDLWASKKTPAELRNKIEQLNATYRMKVDTGLPPIQYQEIPAHQESTYEPVTPAPAPRREVPKTVEPASRTETPKTGTSRPAGTSENNKPKTTANTGGNSGNNTSAVKTASSSQQPSQKQKPKKVVVE